MTVFTLSWLKRYMRSITWLGLASISFLLAALLTWHIAHVADPFKRVWEGGVVVFAVQGAEGTQDRAELIVSFYSGNKAGTLFSFFLPESAQRLIISNPTSFNCSTYSSDTVIPLSTDGAGSTYMDLAKLKRNVNEPIQCMVKAHEFRETYTRTILAFFVADYEPGGGLRTMPIDLAIDKGEGPAEFIGKFQEHSGIIEGRIRLDPPFHIVYVRFTSIWKEQARDWFLVLIGTFVALGASLLVEAARPLVDTTAETRKAA
jgi:hypothetical protein